MATAVWEPLWGSTPINTFMESPLVVLGDGTPRRALLMWKVLSPLSSHAAAGHWRAGGSLRSHTPEGGQALQEPARQMPRTLRVETFGVVVRLNHQALPELSASPPSPCRTDG